MLWKELPLSSTPRPFKEDQSAWKFVGREETSAPIASKVDVLILLFTFFQFYSVVSRDSKADYFASSLFFLLIIINSGLLAGIRWFVCMLKSHRSLWVAFSRTGAGLYICHLLVWSNLQFLLISSESLCRPSRVSPYTPSVLTCCIRLCDWWFHLCHHIACICYFVESYLFSLWYDWFLRRCLVLLLGEILFLSWNFLLFFFLLLLLLLLYSLRVIHIGVCWWSFTRVTAPLSRILLSILAVLNNTVVLMASICPLIYNSSRPLCKHLETLSKRPKYNWYHRNPHVPQCFLFSGNVRGDFNKFPDFLFRHFKLS